MKTIEATKLPKIWGAAILAIFLCTAQLRAAVPKKMATVTALRGQINSALKSSDGIKTLSKALYDTYGNSVLKPLTEIVSNEAEPDETRWACIYTIGRLSGHHSFGLIKKFMNHSNWLLRDAALKTAAALQAKELHPEIASRLKDSSLIIRTTAVNTIGHLNLTHLAPALVSALQDPINFHHGKGLWIHKHILATLEKFHYKQAIPSLVELVAKSDGDAKLQQSALAALEKISGKSFRNKPMHEQKMIWRRIATAEKSF